MKLVKIFASRKIIYDKGITLNGVNLAIFAPTWQIDDNNAKIVLDGIAGKESAQKEDCNQKCNSQISDCSSIAGSDGEPGEAGGSAGNFYGIVGNFAGSGVLYISANGGAGGSGQDGGNGCDGKIGTRAYEIDGKPFVKDKIQEEEKCTHVHAGGKHLHLLESIGTPGSNGGKGGKKGIGGLKGTVNVFDFDNSKHTFTYVENSNGQDGKDGNVGSNGNVGETVPHIFKLIACSTPGQIPKESFILTCKTSDKIQHHNRVEPNIICESMPSERIEEITQKLSNKTSAPPKLILKVSHCLTEEYRHFLDSSPQKHSLGAFLQMYDSNENIKKEAIMCRIEKGLQIVHEAGLNPKGACLSDVCIGNIRQEIFRSDNCGAFENTNYGDCANLQYQDSHCVDSLSGEILVRVKNIEFIC